MANVIPYCEVVPLPSHQASLRVAGHERLRWNFEDSYPRPFFYPFVGPSGAPLTRMGHPGAPNHDHHQSIWFAHEKVLGINFWGNNSSARIRQQEWIAYQDGDKQAIMGCKLGWYDGHDPKELVTQELVAILRPMEGNETLLEVQSTFRPSSSMLEFGKTNFGFFAVRVAKGISEHFGGGRLTSSEGSVGEPAIFGKPAKWMDYSGHVAVGEGSQRTTTVEGITYFDHANNPGHPAHWHVREDGWMCASPCMQAPLVTSQEKPLTLRYQLYGHAGPANAARANQLAAEFNARPGHIVRKSKQKHQMFEIVEETNP